MLLLPTPTARRPLMIPSVPKCFRRCRRPLSSRSHHLRANLPNGGIVRGGEHGSFMRGRHASPSMKGCSPGMNIRCSVPIRHSARKICSNLPARRVDLRGFTRRSARMYLPRFNASRVSHQTWTGRCAHCVRTYPSSRHGRAVSEAAMEGTRAWTALGHREVSKIASISPLSVARV